MERQIIHLKMSYTPLKKKENNYTIETKFYQYGNKVAMFETINKVDEETVTKENNIQFTKKTNSSPLSGNVDCLYEIDTSLIIEANVAKINK